MKDYSEALDLKIKETEETIARWEQIVQNPELFKDNCKSPREAEGLVKHFVGIYDGLMTAKFLLRKTR